MQTVDRTLAAHEIHALVRATLDLPPDTRAPDAIARKQEKASKYFDSILATHRELAGDLDSAPYRAAVRKEARKRRARESAKRHRDAASDSYIRGLLTRDFSFKVPPELIEIKREQILLHRLIKQADAALKAARSDRQNEAEAPSP